MKQPDKKIKAVELTPAEMKAHSTSRQTERGIICQTAAGNSELACPPGYTQVGVHIDSAYPYGPYVGLVCRKNGQDSIFYCSGYDPSWNDSGIQVGKDPYDACKNSEQNDVCRYTYNNKTYEGMCAPDSNTQLFCSGTTEVKN